MSLLVQKLTDHAILPTRGSSKSAGLDLYSPISGTILPRQRLLVPLDISIQLPAGTYGHVLPRSGLAVKNGIHVGAGVIDQDYRGNVGVLLFNVSDNEFSFKTGDRIAQLVVKSYEHVIVEEVSFVDETERGQNGYGSSGL
jgi:dUTP pyrophosphatase